MRKKVIHFKPTNSAFTVCGLWFIGHNIKVVNEQIELVSCKNCLKIMERIYD